MEWLIVIIAIILIIIAFFLGQRFASKPIEDNNDKIRKEYELLKKLKEEQEAERRQKLDDLDSEISWKWQELRSKQEQLKTIDRQYKDKLTVIENTEELAKKAYDAKTKEYEVLLEKEKQNYINTLDKYQEEINTVHDELNSLLQTKAAAIEAAHKEQDIKENKNAYCLILPREEERDISLLREVQSKVSKPRAVAMCIWNGYYQKLAQTKFPRILGKQDVCGIYKITNQKTDECYIGQSNDIKTRWYTHAKAGLGIDAPQGNKLYAAMQEYGLDDFTFELLEECDSKDLDEKEKYFIELYNAKTFGYNSVSGKSN